MVTVSTISRRLLTADQVAEWTGLSLDTLAQWRSQGRGIPYLKIGRAVRYDPSDVHEYLRVAGFLSPILTRGDRNERFQKRKRLLV